MTSSPSKKMSQGMLLLLLLHSSILFHIIGHAAAEQQSNPEQLQNVNLQYRDPAQKHPGNVLQEKSESRLPSTIVGATGPQLGVNAPSIQSRPSQHRQRAVFEPLPVDSQRRHSRRRETNRGTVRNRSPHRQSQVRPSAARRSGRGNGRRGNRRFQRRRRNQNRRVIRIRSERAPEAEESSDTVPGVQNRNRRRKLFGQRISHRTGRRRNDRRLKGAKSMVFPSVSVADTNTQNRNGTQRTTTTSTVQQATTTEPTIFATLQPLDEAGVTTDRSQNPVFNVYVYARRHGPVQPKIDIGSSLHDQSLQEQQGSAGLSRCEWAIISCCSARDRVRKNACFDSFHCSGAWFQDVCTDAFQMAVYNRLVQVGGGAIAS